MEYFQYTVFVDDAIEFSADVVNSKGAVVFEILSTEHLGDLIREGYMNAGDDINGLLSYLIDLKVLPQGSALMKELE